MSITDLPFVCPRCRSAVARGASEYRCASCSFGYPIVSGIPDFRISPDPWIDMADDREKALRLESRTVGATFEAMVREYWQMTPETHPALASRFIAHALEADKRTREWLGRLGIPSPGPAGERWLDIGCGTADLAAVVPNTTVVGVDVAFRWLVVARRRLNELGIEPWLVCCNAEALPFPAGYFSRAFSLGTIEHCQTAEAVFREIRRTLVPGGRFNARTGNKHSVLQNQAGFRFHWPKDARGLSGDLGRAGFEGIEVGAAPVLEVEGARLSPGMRRALPLYDHLRRWPVVRSAVRHYSPMLELQAIASVRD